jgi:hypothetical protein
LDRVQAKSGETLADDRLSIDRRAIARKAYHLPRFIVIELPDRLARQDIAQLCRNPDGLLLTSNIDDGEVRRILEFDLVF